MPLQQKTFENIVAIGEIAQNEQLFLLPQSFHFHSIKILSFIENLHTFGEDAAYLLYIGIG